MIFIITGPCGVGKTDTCWALLSKYPRMVFLDCDWFASRMPFFWDAEADVLSVFEALALMIQFHLAKGNNHFVITMTFQMAVLYPKYRYFFARFQLPVSLFRLRCSDKELARRISARDRVLSQKEAELAGMTKAQADFDRLFPDSSLFHLLNTTELSEEEVAVRLVCLVKD